MDRCIFKCRYKLDNGDQCQQYHRSSQVIWHGGLGVALWYVRHAEQWGVGSKQWTLWNLMISHLRYAIIYNISQLKWKYAVKSKSNVFDKVLCSLNEPMPNPNLPKLLWFIREVKAYDGLSRGMLSDTVLMSVLFVSPFTSHLSMSSESWQ